MVGGPRGAVAGEELLVPLAGEVRVAASVERARLLVGERVLPLAHRQGAQRVERVSRGREEVAVVGAHLVAVDHQLRQPGGDLAHARALGQAHRQPVPVEVEQVVVASAPGPDGGVREVVLVGVGDLVGERRNLRQIARAAVGVLERLDEDDQVAAHRLRALVGAGHQPPGQGAGGVGAAQLVAMDAVGQHRDGLRRGRRPGGGGRQPGIQLGDVRAPEALEVGDGRRVRDRQHHQGTPLERAAELEQRRARRGRVQRAEPGQRLLGQQRPRGGVCTRDRLQRRDGRVEHGAGDHRRDSQALHAAVERRGHGRGRPAEGRRRAENGRGQGQEGQDRSRAMPHAVPRSPVSQDAQAPAGARDRRTKQDGARLGPETRDPAPSGNSGRATRPTSSARTTR